MEIEQRNTPSSDGLSEGLQRMRSTNGRTTGPTRRSSKGQWTAEEDELLCQAVQHFNGRNWKKIAECFKDRTDVQCLHRWQKVLNPELVKGPWSKEEDEMIVQLVKQYGAKRWSALAQHLPGRIGKQCRERWHNHLNPAINKDAWTQEEELALIRAHQIYGNKWAELTKFLPGRTDNSIKNHWNSSVKKKLASGLLDQFQGLPHVTHTNQSTPLRVQQQCSGDEISDCSQGSIFVDNSQSTNEMMNSVRCIREECQLAEELNQGKDPRSSPLSDVAFRKSESFEVGGSSNFGDNMFSDELQNLSLLDLSQQSSGLLLDSVGVNQRHEVGLFPSQNSVGLSTTTMPNIVIGPDVPKNMLISEEECSRLIYPEEVCLTSQSYISRSLCIQSQVLPGDRVVRNQEEFLTFPCDGFYYTNDSSNVQFIDGQDNIDPQEETDQLKESSKLVPADDFSSRQGDDFQKCPSETHVLSYEPPRFPSLDIPFFSCDLIQTEKDMQHEYSPLGIRQHMASSMNCFSPTRLLDSPSRNGSPEGVLKSAAKSFTGTPSILKKRCRDLVSPFSEKRCEKKLDNKFSNLRRDFSRVEVMFVDKENLCSDGGKVEPREHTLNNKTSETSDTDVKAKDDSYSVDGKVQQSSGVLMEQDLNDLLFFSPDKFGSKLDTPLSLSVISPLNVSVSGEKGGTRFVVSSTPSVSFPTPLEIKNGKAVNDASFENSIFSETLFKRSFESPSTWKSPWFINSFVPGPKVDTDISIEDIGYFMSPGERSYDALGLMKQLSEHTASAFASAQDVLGDETPDSILRKRCSNNEKEDQMNCLPSTSDALSKGRVLDFSECGTPGKKGTESKSSSSTISFSSPNSYLLKGCR